MENLYLYSRVSEYDRNADGEIERISLETFDKDGNILTSANDSNGDGTIDYITTNTYDKNGNLLRSVNDNDADSTPDSIETRTYNSNGDVTNINYDLDADGTPDLVETKTYDSNGNITSESSGNGNGILGSLVTYIYNEDGQIVSREDDNNPEGLQKHIRYNTYQYNENGILISEVYGVNVFNYLGLLDEDFTGTKTVKTLEYDDMGNLILEQYFWDEQAIPAATTSYSYNEDGGSTITRTYPDYTTIAISLDANGNLISESYDDNNDGIFGIIKTYTHNDYPSNSDPIYGLYEENINGYATSWNIVGTLEHISNNTFDIYGNITSHIRDNGADGTLDYIATFTNTYKIESADSNSEDKRILIGSNESDVIEDLTGNNNIYGYAGDDSLYGGAANNSLKGGFGNDRLQGYGGKDIIHGNEGNDKLIGGSGNDSLYGNQNRDVLYGNQGNDLLDGGWGNDTLYGNQNQDILYGNQGNDLLDGGWGNDTLYGNQGKDTLYGGAGADVLSGNQDRDIFVYKKASDSSITESDTITDFTAGTDKLLLNFPAFSPIAIGSVNSLDEANVYFDGSSIQVAFSATESVLYVDSTAQGRADMAINLNSVSSLDISDFA